MPVPRLLDDAQHRRYYDLYMKEARSPKDCVAILQSEFDGLESITARQLSTYATGRHWSKRKKALVSKAERKASRLVDTMAKSLAEQKLGLQKKHQEFLEKQANVGAKAVEKAERFIDGAGTARDLSSAINAAKVGSEMYRKAVGLDDAPGGGSLAGSNSTFVFNFARTEGSPFAKAVAEETTDVEAEEVA